MVCKKCGAPLMEDDQFCPECGAKVIRKKRCPECGEVLREGTRFCPSCGAEVGEGRPAKKANPAPPQKKRPVQEERPRRRRDWEEEDWDDDDDDDEESVDILSIMTVAVGCILLVIVAVLGFNLYQRYVPKNYDRAAEEQEKEGEADGEEQAEGQEDGQEDGQRLEEPSEDYEQEETAVVSIEGTIVTIADVRIRDNPSTQGTTVITTAKEGESYEYTEVVEGGHWYKIILPDEYGYEYGYVSADYVETQ